MAEWPSGLMTRERWMDDNQSSVDEPPDYYHISLDWASNAPSYLASVLQPEIDWENSEGSNGVSYAIIPHDPSSALVLSTRDVLGKMDKPEERLARAKYGVRIHSNSIYLYRSSSSTLIPTTSYEENQKNDMFSYPIIEASLNKFINRRQAKLEDWREKRNSHKGHYQLKAKDGMHTYQTRDGPRAWWRDSKGCLYLTGSTSAMNPNRILGCLKPASIAADSHAKSVNARLSTIFNPTMSGSKGSYDKLYNLIGRLDLYCDNIQTLEEELAILTCVATYVIQQRTA